MSCSPTRTTTPRCLGSSRPVGPRGSGAGRSGASPGRRHASSSSASMMWPWRPTPSRSTSVPPRSWGVRRPQGPTPTEPLLGEHAVEVLAELVQLLGRGGPLLGGCVGRELADRLRELDDARPERVLLGGLGSRQSAPGGLQLAGVLGHIGAALLGERVVAAALAAARDQPLVHELLERRIDRAGARAPAPLSALRDGADESVPVGRGVGQQRQEHEPDVAAASATASAGARAEAGAERAEAGAETVAAAAGAEEAGVAVAIGSPAGDATARIAVRCRSEHGSFFR